MWIHLLIVSICRNNLPYQHGGGHGDTLQCGKSWLIWLWTLLCYVFLFRVLEMLIFAFRSTCLSTFPSLAVSPRHWIPSNQQSLCGLWSFDSYIKHLLLNVFLNSCLIFLGILKNMFPETCRKECPYGNPNSYNSLLLSSLIFLLFLIIFRVIFWKQIWWGLPQVEMSLMVPRA